MDVHFCKYFQVTESKRPHQYCRVCPTAKVACNKLWQKVVDLSNSNNGKHVRLPNTEKLVLPNPNTWDIVYLRKNAMTKKFWRLNKEDFLYFISTGCAQLGLKNQRENPLVSPTMTWHGWIQSIVDAIGGDEIPEIIAVRKIQGRSPEI
jgi:hypothetical protein